MTKEEILKDDWVANNYGERGRNWVNLAFLDGVNWMEERMQESNEGKALLYAVEKTAERTKREMIEKAVNWLDEQMYFRDQSSGRGSYGEVKALGCYDFLEEFIDEFKKAMQDEN